MSLETLKCKAAKFIFNKLCIPEGSLREAFLEEEKVLSNVALSEEKT